ncbi:hypothetical protein HMPREF9444_02193 [Succinatimonas hippei YIT 12066]|uniref:Uncharacterized protein n=1 Tax=Succinatimonas hippei (strain DSM 22608 / JCM 16073 / KCTC 15190 / YIT 12066) TaxID=762983 RepID=E8LN40_SUCHY|nr:hypothetical protein HMPREF9444_02193 [Succinatimonas hippei YIT 12066]
MRNVEEISVSQQAFYLSEVKCIAYMGVKTALSYRLFCIRSGLYQHF